MKYNWKYIETPTGKLSYALCLGDKMIRELTDIGLVCAIESSGQYELENSVDDFLADSKEHFEACQRGEYHKRKITRHESGPFKTLQRKIQKAEDKKKANNG